MPERSRDVKKARSPRRAYEDFLHPSQGSASSYRSSSRGSDATLSESIGSLDEDDEDAPGESDDEDEDQGEVDLSTMTPAERLAYKRRMKRFRLNHTQTRFLLSEFARQQHPDAAHRARLAQEIPGLTSRQVQVWFQNRRAKLKRLPSDEQSQVMGSRALPPEYISSHQSFRRIEPSQPPSAYTSSLTLPPSTLNPPPGPCVSLTPPTYTHSPISAYTGSPTPSQAAADDFWSTNPYTTPSLLGADMLTPPQAGVYPPLPYPPPADFSRSSRAASLTGGYPAYEASSYSSTSTQQRGFYSSSSSSHHRGGVGGLPTTTTTPWSEIAPPPLRRPSAQYLSSLTHSQTPPGIRVDEDGYRRATRAGSGDSLFVTTMEELRINPTVQVGGVGEGVGFGGAEAVVQGGFERVGYEGAGSGGGGGFYGAPAPGTGRGEGRGEGRGRRM